MSIEVVFPLLGKVLDAAHAAGLDQALLAKAAGVAPETVSRAKSRGTMDLATLARLADAAGLSLGVMPASPRSEALPPARSPLAHPSRGLAWSNRDMGAQALVRNALLKGSFDLVLQAVLAHGLGFVARQWAQLKNDPDARLRPRQQADVERKLSNIARGLARATANTVSAA